MAGLVPAIHASFGCDPAKAHPCGGSENSTAAHTRLPGPRVVVPFKACRIQDSLK